MGHPAIAAYLIIVPLAAVVTARIGGHDLARIVQVALGLICALEVLLRCEASPARMPAKHLLTLATFVCLSVAAMLHAVVPTMAAREVAIFAGMAVIALAVAESQDPVGEPARIASAASAAYAAAVLLLVVAGNLAGQPLNRAELFVGYDNYRFFNHVQSAAVPLAVLAMTVAPRHSWLRSVAWFAAIGGFALLFAVAGRGTLVAIVTSAVVLGALFGRAAFATLRNLAVAAVLGLLLFALLLWLLPLLSGITPDFSEVYYGARMGSVEARFFLWRIALSYIEQSPWLGIGPMHYAHFRNPEAAHPHNVYLQIAAEWGVPMLLLLVGLGVAALRKLVRAVRRCPDTRQRDCGIGLFLACVVILVDGLFSGNFVMPVSQVWIAFTFGWAMAWMASQREHGQAAPTGEGGLFFLGRIAALSLLVSQLWLVWHVWPEVRHLDEHVKQTMQRVGNAAMNPRFWSHGWF